MLKKVSLVLAASFFVTGVAMAGPLTDYSSGNTSIDVMLRPNADITVKDGGTNLDLDGKNCNFDWSVTTAIDNKWALQYRQFDAKADPYAPWGDMEWRTNSREFNVLYKLDNHLAAYAGIFRAKTENVTTGLDTGTKSIGQLGLTGTTNIAPKTDLYGIVGFGKGLTNIEAGISYAINPDFDLNINYRSLRVTDIPKGDGWNPDSEYKVKGIGCGVTYKF